jgi:hypothetical protein
MFNHILLGLRTPEDSGTLLPVLRTIARPASSRITVMQAAPFLGTVVEMPNQLSPDHHGDEEAVEGLVDVLVAQLKSEGYEADGFADIGQGALIVAAAAERTGASLILLPLRRAGRLAELFRITPVPVLAVPAGAIRRSSLILVPIDDAASLEVIPHAAAMARKFQAEIVFVTSEPQAIVPQAREWARRELVEAHAAIITIDLASTLLSLSSAMIVMRSAPQDVMSRLLRESKTPLLFIRRPPPLPELLPESPLQVPQALWKRRISASPLAGIGDL